MIGRNFITTIAVLTLTSTALAMDNDAVQPNSRAASPTGSEEWVMVTPQNEEEARQATFRNILETPQPQQLAFDFGIVTAFQTATQVAVNATQYALNTASNAAIAAEDLILRGTLNAALQYGPTRDLIVTNAPLSDVQRTAMGVAMHFEAGRNIAVEQLTALIKEKIHDPFK